MGHVLSCDVSAIDETSTRDLWTNQGGWFLTSNGRNVLGGASFFLLIRTIAICATDYVIVMNWIPFKFSSQDGKGRRL